MIDVNEQLYTVGNWVGSVANDETPPQDATPVSVEEALALHPWIAAALPSDPAKQAMTSPPVVREAKPRV